jgi:hypothetical protein
MKFSSICLLAVTASTASAFGVRQPTTQRAVAASLFAKPKIFIDGEVTNRKSGEWKRDDWKSSRLLNAWR